MNNKVYLPVDNINNYQCYVIRDKDTIRVYKNTPRANSNSDYYDFYINSHYIYKSGNEGWGQYPNLPVCMDRNLITNDFYYRNDFDSILTIFFIIVIFGIILPFSVFGRFCKRLWR